MDCAAWDPTTRRTRNDQHHTELIPWRGRSRNAIPLLVGYVGDAMVGDHRSPRVRHAAENVEAGTEATSELAVGLGIPTRAVRTGLTGREDHRCVIRCVADAHAIPGEGHALDLTGRIENPELG